MPRLSAAPISLTPVQAEELQRLARAHKTPRKLAERAEMILRSAAGTGVRATARQLGIWPKTVRHWRACWLASAAETPVTAGLADAARPGAPATFTPEQVCAIMARDHGTGLRAGGAEQPAAQPLEPERIGARGGQTRHRGQYLARLGRAVF